MNHLCRAICGHPPHKLQTIVCCEQKTANLRHFSDIKMLITYYYILLVRKSFLTLQHDTYKSKLNL